MSYVSLFKWGYTPIGHSPIDPSVQMGLVQLGVVQIGVDPKWQEMVEILKQSRDAYKLSLISSNTTYITSFISHFVENSCGLLQHPQHAFAQYNVA